MKKWLCIALACVLAWPLAAQEDRFQALSAKLETYFTALAGESAEVQIEECDFLISSCQDSLVKQYVALKIYDHYLNSKIMGDDAVAVHVIDRWFRSGEVAMHSSLDMLNAELFAEFNRHSLIGMKAPSATFRTPEGEPVKIPGEGYSVLYFYDVSCSTCKIETVRLREFLKEEQWPLTLYAIYVGDNADAWEAYRFEGAVHLWDPAQDGDWAVNYGVLETPKMYLVSPEGIILGRGLDTPALRILMNRELGNDRYVYGEQAQMERFDQLFEPFGSKLTSQDVLDVADYLAARTSGEGHISAFKQVFGDFLYYLSSHKTAVFRSAAIPFVEKYITGLPEVWNTPEDQAQVVSLGEMMSELCARTPEGSLVPDVKVRGQLRQRPCLFRRGSREGVFSLRSLKGRPGYVAFYTGGCEACKELLSRVDDLLSRECKARVLLVDMDSLLSDHYDEARELMDSFDLSGLPFVLKLDRDGTVLEKYVEF